MVKHLLAQPVRFLLGQVPVPAQVLGFLLALPALAVPLELLVRLAPAQVLVLLPELAVLPVPVLAQVVELAAREPRELLPLGCQYLDQAG